MAIAMRKGYQVSDARRAELGKRYYGFRYQGQSDEGDPSIWGGIRNDYTNLTNNHRSGKPGLTVEHGPYGEPCEAKGVGCNTSHALVYRDRHGAPLAYAHTTEPYEQRSYSGTSGIKPMVTSMGSDHERGLAAAIGVGHIAHHLDKIGVEPDTSLTAYSQKLVSHGLHLKERGRDTKLKDYLARRAERVTKGYKLTPDGARAARAYAGAGPSNMWDQDEWAKEELQRVPPGKPGLSIHRNKQAVGGGFGSVARLSPRIGRHTIAYRDSKGTAVTMAAISGPNERYADAHEDQTSRRRTEYMVSDRSRGAIHAIGSANVANAIKRLRATQTHEMTEHSQKMVAHSMEDPGKTAKLTDYLARRRQRAQA